MALPVIKQLTATAAMQEYNLPALLGEKQVLIYNKSDAEIVQFGFGYETGVLMTELFELPPKTPITVPVGGGILFYTGANVQFQLIQIS